MRLLVSLLGPSWRVAASIRHAVGLRKRKGCQQYCGVASQSNAFMIHDRFVVWICAGYFRPVTGTTASGRNITGPSKPDGKSCESLRQ